jgi:hypothetical protein
MSALRIVVVAIATALAVALLAACAPFSGEVRINETPAPPPTPVVVPTQPPAAAPVIIVQPAPVVMPQPAPVPQPVDYTPAILLIGMAGLVVMVLIAVVLTRRLQQQAQPQSHTQAQLPPPVTHVTNHYHLHFGSMTRGDKLAWLVQNGYALEQAKEILDQGVGLSQLPAPRQGGGR